MFSKWNRDGGKTSPVFIKDSKSGEIRPVPLSEWERTGLRGASFNHINLKQIRHWRKRCYDSHGDCCNDDHRDDLLEHLPKLLLVDTSQHCIVELDSSTNFFALSYVWGDVSNVKLTTANIQEFMQPGALHNVPLPHTFRDAISWTLALGERYIWIDSLCVIQDVDTEIMNHVLDGMGHIYASAELTIVAANSNHANFGLPGFGLLSEEDSRPIIVNVGHGMHSYWPTSTTWNRRGWTFQEALYSRRLLVFQEHDFVNWNCGESAWNKLDHQTSLWEEKNRVGWHREFGLPMNIKSRRSKLPPFMDWASAIEDFAFRELSFQDDFERAFAGARHSLGRNFPGGTMQDLPRFFFDIALLWLPVEKTCRRNRYPTWSWLEWTGKPDCTLAWCPYYPMQATRMDYLSAIKLIPKAIFTLASSALDSSRWLNGFYKYQESRYNEDLELPQGWIRGHDGQHVFFTWSGDVDVGRRYPYPLPSKDQHVNWQPEPTITALDCTAQIASMELSGPPKLSIATGHRFDQVFPQTWIRSWSLKSNGLSIGTLIPHSTEHEDLDLQKQVPCLVVALSQGQVQSPNRLDRSELHNCLECNGFTDMAEFHNFYNVLWIDLKDGIATRRGIGIVSQKAWDSLNAETVSFVFK